MRVVGSDRIILIQRSSPGTTTTMGAMVCTFHSNPFRRRAPCWSCVKTIDLNVRFSPYDHPGDGLESLDRLVERRISVSSFEERMPTSIRTPPMFYCRVYGMFVIIGFSQSGHVFE